MTRRGRLDAVLLATLTLLATPAASDVVNPARLALSEQRPGVFEVDFVLPVVQGRRVKARPLLPASCRPLDEPVVRSSPLGYDASWTVACEPASLAGQVIRIQGLVGTQVDVMLQIDTLDGRRHSALLKPARAVFVVPEPPAGLDLTLAALGAGLRDGLRRPELWALLLLVALLRPRWRELLSGIALFGLAHALGQWLAAERWLTLPAPLPATLAAVGCLPAALQLASSKPVRRGWLNPAWPSLLLLGALFGATSSNAALSAGMSLAEQRLAFWAFALGTLAALTLLAAIGVELRHSGELLLKDGGRALRPLGYLLGILAFALLLMRLPMLLRQRPPLLGESLLLMLLALVIGAGLGRREFAGRRAALPLLLLAPAAGLGLGLARLPAPWGRLPLELGLFGLGLALALALELRPRWWLPLAGLSGLAASWQLTALAVENISQATAHAAAAILLAVTVAYAAWRMPPRHAGWSRLIGGSTALLALLLRGHEYRGWLHGELASELALGRLRLPLLSLGLLLAAALAWPRRHRALRQLGVEPEHARSHWSLLAGAFFLLPYGGLSVPNPLHAADAPAHERARRVLGVVLSDTYHAFNIADEDELYRSLSRSVGAELVDDLYLDSRRRLSAGTRQGAEVRVRQVEVLEVGEGETLAGDGVAYRYPCRWAVTARVRHLQHVHHRQNIYEGLLTIRVDDGVWKLAGVELSSEDRVVVPWNPA